MVRQKNVFRRSGCAWITEYCSTVLFRLDVDHQQSIVLRIPAYNGVRRLVKAQRNPLHLLEWAFKHSHIHVEKYSLRAYSFFYRVGLRKTRPSQSATQQYKPTQQCSCFGGGRCRWLLRPKHCSQRNGVPRRRYRRAVFSVPNNRTDVLHCLPVFLLYAPRSRWLSSYRTVRARVLNTSWASKCILLRCLRRLWDDYTTGKRCARKPTRVRSIQNTFSA